jgi:predicted amidohydrolase
MAEHGSAAQASKVIWRVSGNEKRPCDVGCRFTCYARGQVPRAIEAYRFARARTAETGGLTMRLHSVLIGVILTETAMAQVTTRPAQTIKVAVCQVLCIDGDREGNFRRIEYALEQAKREAAQIACLPESVILGWENPAAHRMAAPIPGEDSDRVARLAKTYGLMIAIGLDEKDGDKLYDSAVLVDRFGKLLWRHRKINVLAELMDPPYATGKPEGIGTVDTEFGRIGIMICADTFTEDHIRRMEALKPDLVLVPYGWAEKVDKWPGHSKNLEKLVCKIAKAWHCPVVGTDLVGVISQGPWRGRTYGGASIVADAAGKTVAVLRDRDVDLRVVELRIGGRSRSR